MTNVVFMGMGEPMLNLKAVLEAHRCLNKVNECLSYVTLFPYQMLACNCNSSLYDIFRV